ncbi:hypothetical protein ACFS5L_27090 [Streptomyces phyllanthi]|uniref:DUF4232 domain-containing protein n=1 Tax=Streptomyces phyllanthi TaxID=1803180 RepID=A0A5N8WHA1_9ACTN|nr:hypothetical protein [Streptomyces phyllanthi]MPY45878.1 hypothetical protein [Streptomyces phyllanthi]
MGSLRNPVGPLPSSIYWRRRAVLLTVAALLALLVTWVVTSGDGNGGGSENGANGKNPVPSITPGPTSSGPAISQAPGGRDESSGGGDTSGSGSDSDAGDDGSDASAGGAEATSGSGGGGSGDTGGGSSGEQVPAGSSLPNCTAAAVKLTVRGTKNTYEPGQEPTFELIARNSSDTDCKVDLGPRSTVLTITQADSDDDIWSSADCPEEAASLTFRVPAKGTAGHTLKWNRKPSAPNCATPSGGSAPAGTYLVEAKAPSLTKAQTSFVLAKD